MDAKQKDTDARPVKTGAADSGPLLLSVRDTAQLMGISRAGCWNLVWSNILPSVKIGRRTLIERRAVTAFVRKGGDATMLQARGQRRPHAPG